MSKPTRIKDEEIPDGCVRCDVCDGYGRTNIGLFREGTFCNKCIGFGTLDWLDNVHGQRRLRGTFTNCKVIGSDGSGVG